jgi:SnoaL-like domain
MASETCDPARPSCSDGCPLEACVSRYCLCVALGITLNSLLPAVTRAQTSGPAQVVAQFRAVRVATMQAEASAATVDSLLSLLTDSAVYEHPQAHARIVGPAAIGEGVRAFLGATRHARIEVLRQMVTGAAVAAEERISFEVREESGAWAPRSRTQLTVYLVQGNQVAQELEYWVVPP